MTGKKMDAELKAKWVKALRSGEYKQAYRSLKEGDGYCCLGVLCAIQGIEVATLPQTDVPEPSNIGGLDLLQGRKLAKKNDDGATFSEIADYIEANL
jgi:hypothetical protein